MSLKMPISVFNFSKDILSQDKAQKAIDAINKQIAEHFAPNWFLSAHLTLKETTDKFPKDPRDYKGEAVLYLTKQVDAENAAGYHDSNAKGYPYGFVGLDNDQNGRLDDDWSEVFSHETLELLLDTYANLWTVGPHPNPTLTSKWAFYWYEACDAVQQPSYQIDGVRVANFVLPHYFTQGDEADFFNDYLASVNQRTGPKLKSFGIIPGGYMGYYDLRNFNPGDVKQIPQFLVGGKEGLQALKKKHALSKARRTFGKNINTNVSAHAFLKDSASHTNSKIHYTMVNEHGNTVEEGVIDPQ